MGIVLIAPMFIPGLDGKPIMSIDDWIPRDLINSIGSSTDKLTNTVSNAHDDLSAGTQIYSWRDEHGALHFSDTPVEGAVQVEVQDNTLEMPAERFVQHGLAPAIERETRSGKQAFLLEEKSISSKRKQGWVKKRI